MNKIKYLLLLSILVIKLSGQKVILGGNGSDITVKSSSNYQMPRWEDSASAQKTIDGSGLMAELHAASRFLYQATLGTNRKEIERVANIGFENWIDEQIKIKPSYIFDEFKRVKQDEIDWHYKNGGDSASAPQYFYSVHFNYAWWSLNYKNLDELRQRVAFALSEILVISANSDLGGFPQAMSTYYDLLIKHAFGNFRDLLNDVSYHPAMGSYLSHLNNPASDTANNIRPDENYAREIMQLFTIGLF